MLRKLFLTGLTAIILVWTAACGQTLEAEPEAEEGKNESAEVSGGPNGISDFPGKDIQL